MQYQVVFETKYHPLWKLVMFCITDCRQTLLLKLVLNGLGDDRPLWRGWIFKPSDECNHASASFFFPLYLKWEVCLKLPLPYHFHLIFHIHSVPVCPLSGSHCSKPITYTAVHMEDGDSEDWLIPWNSMNLLSFFLFFCSLSVVGVLWAQIKVWESGRRPAAARSPTKQIACCCADWGLSYTKHEKCGLQGPRAHVVGQTSLGRKERLSQQARATGAMKR